MPTVIAYHDGDVVTEAHVAVAQDAALGCGVCHVHTTDATWRGGDVERRTVAAARSPELRDHLGRQLDALCTFARDNRRWRRALRWRRVDILDVARSTWFTALAEPVHRAWVCEQLLADRPSRLLWITDDVMLTKSGFPSALRSLASRSGVDAQVVTVPGGSPRESPRRRHLSAIRVRLGAFRRDLRSGAAAPRPDPTAQRVLFVEAFPNHLPAPIAVAREVQARGGVQVVFAVAEPIVPERLPPDLAAVRLDTLATRRVRLARHALAGVAGLAAKAFVSRVAAGEGPFRETAALLEPGFRDATVAVWRSAAEITPLAVDVLNKLRPAAVVSSTKAPPGVRAAVFAAKAGGTTSFFLQHGALVFAGEDRWNSVHDRFLVWGERDRQRLVASGLREEDVVVTGSVKFEHLGDRARSGPGVVDANRRTVAYFPSRTAGRFVSVSNAATMLDIVVNGVAAVEGVHLVVKVHPEDRSDIFAGLDDRPRVEVVRDADPMEVMASVPIVIAATSTAGLEACALGRALLVLDLPGVQLPDEYERYGAAVRVSDAAGLAGTLRALVDGDSQLISLLEEGRRHLVDDLFAGLAPGTAVRCADAILRPDHHPRPSSFGAPSPP